MKPATMDEIHITVDNNENLRSFIVEKMKEIGYFRTRQDSSKVDNIESEQVTMTFSHGF
jgi:hypothetical protein